MCIGNKKSKGFTLIELMIVIAIIGIIAAIAMPVYIDYTARAQAAEGMVATAGLQSDIGTFLSDKNYWPQQGSLVGIASLAGKYFNAGDVTITGGDTAAPATNVSVLNIYFRRGSNASQTMMLTPRLASGSMQIQSWQCTGLTPIARLPAACIE